MSVTLPFQILAKGTATIAKAAEEITKPLRTYNELLGEEKHFQQREDEEMCRVDSRFPEPDDSLVKVAFEHIQKTFHKLPHAGTAKANHLIAAAEKDGIQRNAVEWALIRMQEYGWIELSNPVWGSVIGSNRSEPATPSAMRELKQTQWYFGTQEYDIRLTEYFYNPTYCNTCSKLIGDYDYDRSECHDCRSPQGKLADLYVAIHASGDSPDRIREWPTIRALLTNAFGPDRTIEELWELMTDRLRVNGWDEARWLRTKYGDFIELLKYGLLNGRSIPTQEDSVARTPTVSTAPTGRRPIESIEAETPKLNTESMEWIASRKENEEKLGYPTSTLSKYRLESEGGRQLSQYFGVDKDGRRWRRDKSKTPRSAVYYFAKDVKKYGKKA